jgi:hypothetical protein
VTVSRRLVTAACRPRRPAQGCPGCCCRLKIDQAL